MEFWSDYFQVSQNDIITRLTLTLNPTAPSTLCTEITNNPPDLYGPIWIMNLLIFGLSVFSNLFGLLVSQLTGAPAPDYEFSNIGFSVSMVYGSFLMFTAIFMILNKVLGGGNMNTFQVACVYGYSFAYYFAATVLSIIPIEFLRALIWIAAGVASTFMLLKNFKEFIETREGNARMLTLSVIAVFQLVLTLTFWIHFF